MPKRQVFVVSNSTAITAETLAHSMLAQFPDADFRYTTFPYVDSAEKVDEVLDKIHEKQETNIGKAIIFSTLANPDLRKRLLSDDVLVLDPFDSFIQRIADEIEMTPMAKAGVSHRISDQRAYQERIEAVNYTLMHDDGAAIKHLDQAELVILGVSRTAKTPTSLYLAMHFSIRCANYPLTPDDMEGELLPKFLKPYRDKLVGLTTSAERLSQIREERRPGSRYATLEQCRFELQMAENIYIQERIPFVNTEYRSIEEISAIIIQQKDLARD